MVPLVIVDRYELLTRCESPSLSLPPNRNLRWRTFLAGTLSTKTGIEDGVADRMRTELSHVATGRRISSCNKSHVATDRRISSSSSSKKVLKGAGNVVRN